MFGECLGAFGDGQGVRARLADDAHTKRGFAVQPECRIGIFRTGFDPRHIRQARERTVGAARDDKLLKLGLIPKWSADAQGYVLISRLQATGGQLDILAAQGIFHIQRREAQCRKAVWLQPNTHRWPGFAAYEYARHTIESGEPVHQIAVDIVAEFKPRPTRFRHHEKQYGRCIGIDLAHFRREHFFRQIIRHPADTVADIVRCAVHGSARREFDGDLGLPVARTGRDGLNAFNARKRVFQHLRHPRFDHTCCRAGIGCAH